MPTLAWDIGTAYDLFISLAVLSRPAEFGVPAQWAAGVRSRVPVEVRWALEQLVAALPVPFAWLSGLPDPKDAATALAAFAALPAQDRLRTLMMQPDTSEKVREMAAQITRSGRVEPAQVELLRTEYRGLGVPLSADTANQLCAAWVDPQASGQGLLDALRAYVDVFFAEEEARIWPALRAGLEYAQGLAADLSLPELLEQLSQGVHFENLLRSSGIILAPSFWSHPLAYYGHVSADRSIVLFGSRPASSALVPGEVVPDQLLTALRALADPTRLRILRYLVEQPMTPGMLAHRLRLRPPTVVHHLHALRLAGLVRIDLQAENERRYSARLETLASLYGSLDRFLKPDRR